MDIINTCIRAQGDSVTLVGGQELCSLQQESGRVDRRSAFNLGFVSLALVSPSCLSIRCVHDSNFNRPGPTNYTVILSPSSTITLSRARPHNRS